MSFVSFPGLLWVHSCSDFIHADQSCIELLVSNQKMVRKNEITLIVSTVLCDDVLWKKEVHLIITQHHVGFIFLL